MNYNIKQETVVLIFDRNGKFFRYDFNVDRAKGTAEIIKGSYRVIKDE